MVLSSHWYKFIILLHESWLFYCSEMTLIACICSSLPNLTLCKMTSLIISWRAAPGQCQYNCSTLHTVTLFYGPETASTDDHNIPALQQNALLIRSDRDIQLYAISFTFEWSYIYIYNCIVLSPRVIKRKGLFVCFSRVYTKYTVSMYWCGSESRSGGWVRESCTAQ